MVSNIIALADDDWKKLILDCLQSDTTSGKVETIRKRATRFFIIKNSLFKKVYNLPYLKCLGSAKAYNMFREIHEGICGNHIGSRLGTPSGILLVNNEKKQIW